MTFEFLKSVYLIADKIANERFTPLKEEFIRKRRVLFHLNKLEEYKYVVIEMNESESLIKNETLIQVMSQVGEDCY